MKLSKFRIAAAAAVFIVLAPAVAFAVSPFTDVIPGKFYEAPVEWALDNGITTGKTATTFEPDSPVTRGETVTFLKRFNDNVVKQTVGSLSCTTGQLPIHNGTSWACGTPEAASDTMADLTCTTSQIPVFGGTNWGCGTDQTIADTNTDTMAGLTCTAGQIANYDGTNWACKTVVFAIQPDPTEISLASVGDVGLYSSIAVGTDGYPIVSYYDSTNSDLKAYHCTAADCSTGSAVTLDSTGSVGQYNSIAIGTDNYPIVSYYDSTNSDLKAYHCTAADCSTGSAVTLDSTGDVGLYSSIAIGTDNYPIISYGTGGADVELKVFHCTSVDCSTGTALTLDDAGLVGYYTSIAIGTDNYPIISYLDLTNGNVKIYHCSAVDCSTGEATSVHDGSAYAMYYTSIAVGSDGYPVIAYVENSSGRLMAYHCTAADCSAGSSTTLDTTGTGGSMMSIAIGADGFPIMSYFDPTRENLKSYHCTAVDCSSGTAATVAFEGSVGHYSSITIGADGRAVVTFYKSFFGDLMFVGAQGSGFRIGFD